MCDLPLLMTAYGAMPPTLDAPAKVRWGIRGRAFPLASDNRSACPEADFSGSVKRREARRLTVSEQLAMP